MSSAHLMVLGRGWSATGVGEAGLLMSSANRTFLGEVGAWPGVALLTGTLVSLWVWWGASGGGGAGQVKGSSTALAC